MRDAPARIWILPALHADISMVVCRKPHKVFHTFRWDTATGELTYGAQIDGPFYPTRCDISFDGRYWVYLAPGAKEDVNAVSEVPLLNGLAWWENFGSWFGGGFFKSYHRVLRPPLFAGGFAKVHGALPGYSFGWLWLARDILGLRLRRDGWRHGPGKKWQKQGAGGGRSVTLFDLGYQENKGQVYKFVVENAPKNFNEGIFWATFDSSGRLLVARRGVLELYADPSSWTPSASINPLLLVPRG